MLDPAAHGAVTVLGDGRLAQAVRDAIADASAATATSASACPAGPATADAALANGRSANSDDTAASAGACSAGSAEAGSAAGGARASAGVSPADGGRDAAPMLVVCDGWNPALVAGAAARAWAMGAAFLPVQVELGRAFVGPTVVPGRPGCTDCAVVRRAAAEGEPAERAELLRRNGNRLAEPSPWLTAFAVRAVSAIAAGETLALLVGERPRTVDALLVVDLERLTTDVHPFLPDPLCPVCAAPPDDGPDAATVTLTPRPKPAPATLRATDLAPHADHIRRTYVDVVAGVVSEVRDVGACGLPVSYAPAGWRDSGRSEIGIGRGADRVGSGLAAVLEAVERRSGLAPAGRRTVVRASFTAVAGQAVDPRQLGLFAPEQYERQGFPYPPFDADRELEWVWGYSFRRAGPVLVPRTYAYYGHGLDHSERPITYETSNGCALGTCFEEAALHGLLEVAERDAFLLTWYARLPAARVAIGSARSPEVRLLADRIRRTCGYAVHAFDTTAEQGIPAVAVLAVDADGTREDRPAVLCAAAAHLDPERACWAALGELALVVEHHLTEYRNHRERAAAMVADPYLVRDMEDHAFLHGHRDTVPRWDFLLRSPGEAVDFDAAFRGRPAPTMDLLDDLRELTGRYLASGLDVIVVDQTGPEPRAENLVSVKVIVPGTLPMTFGHRNRRTHGLPRLDAALRGAEPNPHPHPFP